MSEVVERSGSTRRAKTACRLLVVLAAAVALAGLILIALGQRNGTAAVLIAVSSCLTIGLCVILQHLYGKRIDRTWSVVCGRLLHGLMLYALFLAVASFLYADVDGQNAMTPLTLFMALADAALAATMVFLIAVTRRNRDGAANTCVWIALLLGMAVFALRFLNINWLAWSIIAALAVVTVVLSAGKRGSYNSLCHMLFALAIVVLAVLLLVVGSMPKAQMILHIVCLILALVYAFAAFLVSWAHYDRQADAGESCDMRNGKTVIVRRIAGNSDNDTKADLSTAEDSAALTSGPETAAGEQGPDAISTPAAPQPSRGAGQEAVGQAAPSRAADAASPSRTRECAKEAAAAAAERHSAAEASEAVPCDRPAARLNCDAAVKNEYRMLSLRYLSLAPLDAFSGVTEVQLACMKALGVHTVSELAALPAYRAAEQIVRIASREE